MKIKIFVVDGCKNYPEKDHISSGLSMFAISLFNPKKASGSILNPLWFLQNYILYREDKAMVFVITRHIFPKNCIEVLQVIRKICRFSSSMFFFVTIFINILDFLTFPCWRQTNDVSI